MEYSHYFSDYLHLHLLWEMAITPKKTRLVNSVQQI